jgi:hypothetical protein
MPTWLTEPISPIIALDPGTSGSHAADSTASPAVSPLADTIGVLINNAAQFVNGSEQQPQFVIEMLECLGLPYRVFSHRGKADLCGIERCPDFHGTSLELLETADLANISVFIMICHIVEDTSELAGRLKERLAGKRVVQFHCGNHCLFNAEDIVFNKHNVVRLLFNSWFDECWVFDMHYFARDYYELLTSKPCRLMPYAWTPTLLCNYMQEHKLDISCTPEKYTGQLTLCCFEPNLNVTKTCISPLLIMNEFYKRHPERVYKCFIFCSRHLLEHKSFKDFLAFTKVATDQKCEFYPRMGFPDVLKQLREKDLNPVIVGNQFYNHQNYLSLEALYLGYPLVHNSPSIQYAGVYYDDWNLHDAVRGLELIANEFHSSAYHREYMQRANRTLREHSTSNPVLLDQLRRLLGSPAAPLPI